MKIDMHCHTREGSPDGKVPIEQYIRMLRNQGFGGMLVTDHDSYGGYRYWKNNIKGDKYQDFLVLKGIEYDTLDAGHILVIMPETIKLRLLELRGIPVQMLIPIVHNYGGILGPAHPCGEKYMSFMNAKAYQRNPDILKEFDFMEIFNACEPQEVNDRAKAIAKQYGLPGTGGLHRSGIYGNPRRCDLRVRSDRPYYEGNSYGMRRLHLYQYHQGKNGDGKGSFFPFFLGI